VNEHKIWPDIAVDEKNKTQACMFYGAMYTHTHTHTHTQRERERERERETHTHTGQKYIIK